MDAAQLRTRRLILRFFRLMEDLTDMNTSAPDAFFTSAVQHDCTARPVPCRAASPLHIDYGSLMLLAASGRERDACLLLRESTPFGGLLSALGDPLAAKACSHAAETSVFSVLVRHLVRTFPDIPYAALNVPSSSGKKALVIGSGPAGLQAAWTLREHGHEVTVFEAAPSPGMTLLHEPVQESSSAPSAPSPAVPADIVERTVDMLSRSGIKFRCSCPVGQSHLSSLCEEYDLVLCACGKGAVFPADADGRINDRLFAAGTCVKNQKLLGALQSMAFARKTALAACRALNGGMNAQAYELSFAPSGTEDVGISCKNAAAPVESVQALARHCRICRNNAPSDLPA